MPRNLIFCEIKFQNKKIIAMARTVRIIYEYYEVWVENTDDEGLSNSAKTITQLNKGDIIVSIRS